MPELTGPGAAAVVATRADAAPLHVFQFWNIRCNAYQVSADIAITWDIIRVAAGYMEWLNTAVQLMEHMPRCWCGRRVGQRRRPSAARLPVRRQTLCPRQVVSGAMRSFSEPLLSRSAFSARVR